MEMGFELRKSVFLVKCRRNPGLNRRDYEFIFNKYLGVKKVIWLNKGIVDDTHGHIDDIARFVSKNSLLAYENKKKAKTLV